MQRSQNYLLDIITDALALMNCHEIIMHALLSAAFQVSRQTLVSEKN